jgi:hypothetical protein
MKTSTKKLKDRDLNRLAAAIVDAATDEEASTEPSDEEDTRNPHAVALGKLGGKKGGEARAKKLTSEQKHEIAKKAAEARWAKANATTREE